MSIMSVLNIGAEAIAAQQQAVQTTSHNLANVNTPGYSRQRVELTAAKPDFLGRYSLGRGVVATGVTSVVDGFLEAQLVGLQGSLGYNDAEHRALEGVAAAFPVEEGKGVGAALNGFFAALSDLANNPAGQAERVSLIGKAQSLADTLRQTREILTTVQINLDKDLNAAVIQANALLPQIASLNSQILSTEVGGNGANDLRDQRQQLLQELSSLTGATIVEESNGQVLVQANGLLLVSGDRAATLTSPLDNTTGFHAISYEAPGGMTLDATAMVTGGEIGGLIAARDTTVTGFIDQLDQLAYELVNAVNTQHAAGVDLTGTAGGDFFTAIPAATPPLAPHAGAAALIQVDGAIVTDPRRIAAAQDATALPGDNRNALALVNLRTTAVAALGTVTFENYFSSLVADVGGQLQASNGTLAFQQSLLTETQTQRESISGVNIDEEMTNLIKFQRAFEAASLLVRTGDELYQSVLDMIR